MSDNISSQQNNFDFLLDMSYFLNYGEEKANEAAPQTSYEPYEPNVENLLYRNLHNTEIFPTATAEVIPVNALQSPSTPIPAYHKAEIQLYSSIEKKYRAQVAVIDAESRLRKEEEARNAIASDCQIIASNGQLCAYTKGRYLKPILSKIPAVYRINPSSHYDISPYYLLCFSDLEQCCYISVGDLCKPGQLAAALEDQAPDVKLLVYGKERKLVIEALAQHLHYEAKSFFYPYFLGWRSKEGHFQFSLLGGTTHSPKLPGSPEKIEGAELFQQKSPAVTITAVRQTASLFRYIEDENIRQLLFIWWHISFLYSLLAKHEYAPSIGLCIDCPDAKTFRAMESIFRWYSDPPISLAEEPAQFQNSLSDRKDQPLLVACQSCNARNEATLLNMLKSHTIPSPDYIDPLPQRAPLTILIQSREYLLRDPSLLCIELSPIDPKQMKGLQALPSLWRDYFQGFAHFTAKNTAMLWELLDNADGSADIGSDGSLSYEGEEFLLLYRGIRRFLRNYLTSLDATQAAVTAAMELLNESDSYLIELLERSSSSRNCDCERFLWAAQKVLETGSILLVDALKPISMDSKDTPTVFYDRDYCYFNLPAFRLIACETRVPPRELTVSLKDANLLMGPFVNTGSAQARLPTKYLAEKEDVRVYKIPQSYIDDGRGAKSFFRR